MRLFPKLLKQHPAAVILYFTLSSAFAQTYLPASAVGTGGTGRAAVGPGEAIYLNPAILPHVHGHHFFFSGKNKQRAYAMTDNTKDSILPGEISWEDFEVPGGSSGTLSMALAEFIRPNLSFGIKAKQQEVKLGGGVRYSQTNMDMGVLWATSQSLGFGFTQNHIFDAPANLPDSLKLKPQTSLALTYVYKEFARFKLDLSTGDGHDGSKPTTGLGLETFFNEWLAFRLGYRNQEKLSKSSNSAGLGFHGPVFYVDWAYEGDTKSSSDYSHTIDFGIPF